MRIISEKCLLEWITILHKMFIELLRSGSLAGFFVFQPPMNHFREVLYEWLTWIVTYSINDNKLPMIESSFHLTIVGVLAKIMLSSNRTY